MPHNLSTRRHARRPSQRVRRVILVIVGFVMIAPALAGCGAPAETSDLDSSPTMRVAATDSAERGPSVVTATSTTISSAVVTEADTSAANAAIAPEATTPATEPPAPDSAPDLDSIREVVDALVAGTGGLTSVMVMLPEGDVLYENMASEPLEAASLYKLAVMVELFRQRDAGGITFDDLVLLEAHHFNEGGDVFSEEEIGLTVDVATLLEAMITLSSNVAATALLQYAGTDNVNATMQDLGLVSTEIRWYPGGWDGPTEDDPAGEPPDESDELGEPVDTEEPETGTTGRELLRTSPPSFFTPQADRAWNVTSAADVATLYRLLVNGDIVSPEASQEMLDLLTRQGIIDRLPAYLPEGTMVAHKTGNLDGLVHDAGVVFAPAGPIIVVVMTENVDAAYAVDMIAQIALLAYAFRS